MFSDSFSIDLMFSNFLMDSCYKHYELGGCGGVG